MLGLNGFIKTVMMSLNSLQQIYQKKQWFFAVVCFVVILSSCSSGRSVENRILHADNIVLGSKLAPESIKTPYFSLHSAYSFYESDGLLTIYIEGDGRSWVSRYQLSNNPTPINPVALNLAIIHAEKNPNSNIAWLARPCQYQLTKGDVNCESKYWSSHRFSEQVIQSTNNAIDQLVKKSDASKVRLIGFSGGAAVAVLVAARRDDVDSIVSIAGNLDHQQVNIHHGVTPLRGSFNPMDVVEKISSVPQLHFIGAIDKVIPVEISTDFISAQKNTCAQQVIVPDAEHIDGWLDYWHKALINLNEKLSCDKLSVTF